nr:restriction endonuclease subunit S [Anoxybacillus flavithermus]
MVGETKFITAEIGVLPEGWKLIDIKSIADRNQKHSFIDGDWIEAKYIENNGIRLIQTGNIGIGHFIEKETKKYISEKTFHELNCKEVKPGDILICRLAAPIGRACIAPDLGTKAITAVDVVILKVNQNEYSREYINYYLNFEKTLQRMESFASGSTRQRISRTNLGNVLIAIPPLAEQRKIAAILSSVDEAIEKTKAIIEQTEKVKKGLMQQLLTKGIGHTKFKKTEIGEIPEEWEVMNIGRVCKEIYRYPTYYNIDYVEKGVPEIRGEMLKPNGEIDTNPENIRYISEETASRFPRTKLEKHDIVMSVRGTIGKVGIVPSELAGANITANLIRLSPKEHIIDKIYFKYFLLSDKFKKSLDDISTATTIKTLKAPDLKNIPIPVPDLIEQRKIVSIMKTIDKKLLNETTTLDKLNSIKKFLMQVLLTGKVRVKVDDEVMSQ